MIFSAFTAIARLLSMYTKECKMRRRIGGTETTSDNPFRLRQSQKSIIRSIITVAYNTWLTSKRFNLLGKIKSSAHFYFCLESEKSHKTSSRKYFYFHLLKLNIHINDNCFNILDHRPSYHPPHCNFRRCRSNCDRSHCLRPFHRPFPLARRPPEIQEAN